MRSKIVILIALVLVACQPNEKQISTNASAGNDSLRKELKGLTQELRAMKALMENQKKSDSTIIIDQKESPKISKKSQEIQSKEKREIIKKEIKPKEIKPTEIKPTEVKPTQTKFVDPRQFEKIYYYKNSKQISVYISPRKDERSVMKLYDLKGNLTYEFESVFQSYTISAEIKSFHSNGAVSVVTVHTNPGASMYMYESTYSFSDQNEPLVKQELKFPATLDDYMDSDSKWNKETKKWEK